MDGWKRMQARQRNAREAVRLRAEARGVRPLTAKGAGRRVIISVEWWIIGFVGLLLAGLLYRSVEWAGLSGRYTALACLAIGWMFPVVFFTLVRRRRRG